MSIVITKDTHPAICAAFRLIEEDNGGDLIGTVYPGEPINLDGFEIPDAFAHLVVPAEAGLARLRAMGDDFDSDWHSVVCGEVTDADFLRARQGDLDEAQRLMVSYFDGWPE